MDGLLLNGWRITAGFEAGPGALVSVCFVEHARRLIDRAAGDPDVLRLLRDLAGSCLHLLARQRDADILGCAARALDNGTLRLYEAAPGPVAIYTARGQPAPAAPGPSPSPSPSRPPVRAPGPVTIARARAAVSAEVAVIARDEDINQNVDQNAQAKTPVRVAVDGTPFCAVCERMKGATAARAGVPA